MIIKGRTFNLEGSSSSFQALSKNFVPSEKVLKEKESTLEFSNALCCRPLIVFLWGEKSTIVFFGEGGRVFFFSEKSNSKTLRV